MKMKGYKRNDGQIGIRNHIAVIYTVECAHHVANLIAGKIPNAEVFGFPGCFHDPYGFRMLVEMGKHPNVAGVIVVRLGCESTDVDRLVEEISETKKRVELIHIQDVGGTIASINKGKEIGMEILAEAEQEKEVNVDIKDLIIGVECGGSDATSGLSANPATGWAVDQLIEKGSTVIFSEMPELLGCHENLLQRVGTKKLQEQLLDGLDRAQKHGQLLDIFAVSSGNEQGGLTTIEEKSLGALVKAGTKPINGILKTSEKPKAPGLYLLDKVGMIETNQLTLYEENDNDGLVSLIASGAHMMLFTTGRGSVVGSVIAPVIKICGNPVTANRMKDNMDINAGKIIEREKDIHEVGEEILKKIYKTANGEQTKAEILGHKEYHIPYKPGRACDVL